MAVSTDDEYCSRSSNVATSPAEAGGAGVACWLAGGRLRARGCLNNVDGVEMLVWSSSLLVVGSGV